MSRKKKSPKRLPSDPRRIGAVPVELSAKTYLRIAEVCTYIDVDESTLWRWADAGKLIPSKEGGVVRYARADIDAFMTSRKQRKARARRSSS